MRFRQSGPGWMRSQNFRLHSPVFSSLSLACFAMSEVFSLRATTSRAWRMQELPRVLCRIIIPALPAIFCGACIIRSNVHKESWCALRREKSWMSPSTCDGAPQRLGAGRRCGSPVKINACCGCRWVSRTDSECSRKKRTSFTRRPIFTRRNTNAHSRGTIPNSRSTGSWTANRLYRQGTSGAWRFPTPKPSNKFPMRVTIFGASGLLGKALVREWSGDTVTAPSSPDADIRDSSRVRQIVRETRPEWIVLSAAYTDVDGCESNAELAFAVNRDGAMNVATAAKEVGARLLFLSSDYVFDGKKTTPYEADDSRNPQSVVFFP